MKEYRLRFITLGISAVGVAIFIACVLLFPSYVVSNIKIREALSKKNTLETSPLFIEKNNLEKVLKGTRSSLAIVGNATSSAMAVVDLVISQMSPQIKIFHLEYQNANPSSTFIVNGVALTRQALLEFEKRLEQNPQFSKVDFPISDLSKGSNIEFTFTINGTF